MRKNKFNNEKPKRSFREATDGMVIRKWYATTLTADLARMMGLTVKQIENYIYRHNTEPWARKKVSLLSQVNSENVKKRWSKEKNAVI